MWDLLRGALFRMNAESAHEIGLWAVASGLASGDIVRDSRLRVSALGVEFPNPLGLAAGFDKNAVALENWENLGFGFVEVGTVTRHEQPGNPKPRLFRLPEDRALINRFGFNNEGALRMAERLAAAQPGIPYGINLGKSRVTPLEKAVEDYVFSYLRLHSFGTYAVINVSSPNTPGLRQLQDRAALAEIATAVREVAPQKPLLVKVSPDLTPEALDDVVRVVEETGLAGVIATNTTLSRIGLLSRVREDGGLSGSPLRSLSEASLRHLAQALPKDKTLISVGGIESGRDAFLRIAIGAHLVQSYTGFVYGGPNFAGTVLRELLGCMNVLGLSNLEQLRGSNLDSPSEEALRRNRQENQGY